MPTSVRIASLLLGLSLLLALIGTTLVYPRPEASELPGWLVVAVASAVNIFMAGLYAGIVSGRKWALLVCIFFYLIGLPSSVSYAGKLLAISTSAFLVFGIQMLSKSLGLATLLSPSALEWFDARKAQRQAAVRSAEVGA